MSHHLSRRRLLTSAGSTVAAALLAACGGALSSPPVTLPPADQQVPQGAAALLDRRPYLQNISSTKVVISWQVQDLRPSWLRIGPAGGTVRQIDVAGSKNARVTLDDLQPGTTYEYAVGVDNQPLTPRYSFHSAPSNDATDMSFVVFGDSGEGTPAQNDIAGRIHALKADIALHTGDVVYGKPPHFDKRYFDIYADTLATTAVFPAIGDNDNDADGGKSFLKAFVLPDNGPADGTSRAYSFDYGPAHFIALDTESDFDKNSAQTNWLADDLARTQQPWKFVFFHRPPYSVGDDREHNHIRKVWAPLFERYAVAAVFSGHDHNYQRTKPIRDFSSGPGGVVYIITGGAGAELREVTKSDPTVFAAAVYHVVQVQVAGANATIRAVQADGSVIDEATIQRPG